MGYGSKQPALDFNQVIMIGTIHPVKDEPILRIKEDKKMCYFTLRSNRMYSDSNGIHKSEGLFIQVVVWGKYGENIYPRLHAGDKVFVEGYLKDSRWVDKTTGKPRSRMNIVANKVIFFGDKTGDEEVVYDSEVGMAEGQPEPTSEGAPF